MKFVIFFLLFIFLSCNTHKKIIVKEDKHGKKNRLIINTEFRKVEFGVVLVKPLSLGFSGLEMIYNLSILDSKDVTIWEIGIENKNSGTGIIQYGKVPKAYKQITG